MNFNEMPIGERLSFGYNAEDEPYVWTKMDESRLFCIFDPDSNNLVCFDTREAYGACMTHRSSGNSLYRDSNIHQWLNSQQSSWYSPQGQFDQCNDTFKTIPGFLSNFSEEQIACMNQMSYTCVVPNAQKANVHHAKITMNSLVTIPSIVEVFRPNQNNGQIGRYINTEWETKKISKFACQGKYNQILGSKFQNLNVNNFTYDQSFNCITRSQSGAGDVFMVRNYRYADHSLQSCRCAYRLNTVTAIISIKPEVQIVKSEGGWFEVVYKQQESKRETIGEQLIRLMYI